MTRQIYQRKLASGMDAIVIQIAKEFGSPLVSLDMEMTERSRFVVDIIDIEDVMKS